MRAVIIWIGLYLSCILTISDAKPGPGLSLVEIQGLFVLEGKTNLFGPQLRQYWKRELALVFEMFCALFC